MNSLILKRSKRKIIPRIQYRLNTSLCQFTSGASKTKKAIEFLKHFSILSRIHRGPVQNGTHHLNIILTNKSLIEATMWVHRLKCGTQQFRLNICSLSSKKNSTFNSLDQILTKFVKAKSSDEFPDILIMCTHDTRTADMVELLLQLEHGNLDFTNIGIHQITATIMFDEADKNIGLIAEFLKELNRKLISTSQNTILRDIHFITATPGKKFWKKLTEADIHELENIHHYLRVEEVFDYNHDLLYQDYRSIDEHNICSLIDNIQVNPVEYAELVLEEILKRKTETNEVLTIFAPSELEKRSHYEMGKLFQRKGFAVLILNSDQKGFSYPEGNFDSIDEFNKRHHLQGELYYTLVKWREENRNKDLVITGFLNVQRGVTFCTIGFNFTDMIISSYHLKDIDALIQILGRANGEKQYVQILNIWSPKSVIDKANQEIEIYNQLHKRDPEIYIESDFRGKTPKEVKKNAETKPDIIYLSSEKFWMDIIRKKGNRWDLELILSSIGSQDSELEKELRSMTKKQISLPNTDNSIKKHITDLVKASKEGKTFSIDISKKEMYQDVYQIFLDPVDKKLVISRYYGSKLAK